MSRGGSNRRYPGVKDLGGGTYQLDVYYTPPATAGDPKPKQIERRRTVQAGSITDALRMKLDLEDELKREVSGRLASKVVACSEQRLFGDVIDEWFRGKQAARFENDPTQALLKPSTRKKYDHAVRFLKTFFGAKTIAALTVEVLKDWRLGLIDPTLGRVEVPYKRSTVNTLVVVLRMVLGSVGSKAAHELKPLDTRADRLITRKEPNQLTADEFDRFLDALKGFAPHHYALVMVLLTTTLRLSTALALRRDAFQIDTGEIIVTHSLSEGVLVRGTKPDRFADESVPLLPEVLSACRALWGTFNAAQAASGLAFPAEDGRHHSRSVLRKPFERALSEAGITKRFTPNGCRRTGVRLYGRTVGTRLAMEIAGHRTEAMHRHYRGELEAEERLQAAHKTFRQLRVVGGASVELDAAEDATERNGMDGRLGEEVTGCGDRVR